MKILKGPDEEEFLAFFHSLSVFDRLKFFLDYDFDRTYFPSEEELRRAWLYSSPEEILKDTIKYSIGQIGFQIAIDKGLYDCLPAIQILKYAIKLKFKNEAEHAIALGADVNELDKIEKEHLHILLNE